MFAVQAAEEYGAGVVDDQGLDAVAAAPEPELVSSKSKMQVCKKNIHVQTSFCFMQWVDVNAAIGDRLGHVA